MCSQIALSCAVALFLADIPAGPSETALRALVEQLGAQSYRQRANAEKAIVELGPRILPLLNNIETAGDLETATRLKRIRRALDRYEVSATWDDQVRFSPAGLTPFSGRIAELVARVRLVRAQGFLAVPEKIQLIAEVHAAEHPAREELRSEGSSRSFEVPLERWHWDPGILAYAATRDNNGVNYNLVLPWSTYRPEIQKLSLRLRFESISESAAKADTLESAASLAEAKLEIHLRSGQTMK